MLFEKVGPGPHPCHWECGRWVTWSHRRTAEGCLIVDHVDGDPSNNTPENLVPSCHSCNLTRIHDQRFADGLFVVVNGTREAAVQRVCQRCGKDFLFRKKFVGQKKSTGAFCSRVCHYGH